MDWGDIRGVVSKVAPVLGGALGGGAGLAVGQLIATALGVDPTPTAVNEALKNNPDALIKIKELEAGLALADIKESNDTLRAMLVQDAISPQSTRPKIAYGAFWVVTTVTMFFAFSFLYAVLTGQPKLIDAIVAGWPFAGVLTLPFIGWLNHYFGILAREQRDKISIASGKEPSPKGLIEMIMKIKGGSK